MDNSLKAQINLSSRDVKHELDQKSLELGFLIEKQDNISDFSYEFLKACRKSTNGYPYMVGMTFRAICSLFGQPHRYSWEHEDKSFDYHFDYRFHELRDSKIPIYGKALYMVASACLLNGIAWQEYDQGIESTQYLKPLYIGRTNNLYERWKNHHRMDQFNFLCKLDIELFLLMYFVYKEDGDLGEMERMLIKELNPLMNNEPVLERK